MDQINESIDIIVQYSSAVQSDHAQILKVAQLTSTLTTRPLYSIQSGHICSIRQYFQEKNWLLLPTYASFNAMHLCPKTEFEQNISTQLMHTGRYQLIRDCTNICQNEIQSFFDAVNKYIVHQLRYLLRNHRITREQYLRMTSLSKHAKTQIHSMKFLPDIRRRMVSFRPMLCNTSGPIAYIAQFLHQFLQTRYSILAHSTTLHNGADAVQAIEAYAKKGFFKPTTHFITLEVTNFDIKFTHKQIIDALKLFLPHCTSHPSNTLNISDKTIIRLARLVLRNQHFLYDDKVYQQIKGSDPDSSLTKVLVNIYLLHWQQDLMQLLKRKKEFFGRCDNTMLFTWNGPKRTFYYFFSKIRENLPALPMHLCIGKLAYFLDVELSYDHGMLRTKMIRSGLTDRYTVPYLNNAPLNQYSTLLRKHLIYAVRSCNQLRDFQEENILIQSTYLMNGFPLDFINNCIRQFFIDFNPSKLDNKYNQKTYEYLRSCIIMKNQNYVD